MKITIEIDTPEEMSEIASFLEKKNHIPVSDRSGNRRDRLEKLFNEVRGHLPQGYKFNRDELYDRKSLR